MIVYIKLVNQETNYSRGKIVKCDPCHAMKSHRGFGDEVHIFINCALEGGEWSPLYSGPSKQPLRQSFYQTNLVGGVVDMCCVIPIRIRTQFYK
jgi:hypothetical protein